MAPTRVLFVCTANSARSQMAEGLLRRAGGDEFEVSSAGAAPSALHPLAIRVMAERGVDIRRQRSESLDDYRDQAFDFVITVCDRAAESCPVFPGGGSRIHAGFPDPAAEEGSFESRIEAFRVVRDRIEVWLREWLEGLSSAPG